MIPHRFNKLGLSKILGGTCKFIIKDSDTEQQVIPSTILIDGQQVEFNVLQDGISIFVSKIGEFVLLIQAPDYSDFSEITTSRSLSGKTIHMDSNVKNMLTFTAVGEPSTIQLTKVGTPYGVKLEYRIDDGTWDKFTPGSTLIELENGQKTQLRSTVEDPEGTVNQFSKNIDNYYKFVMTGKISASGNIQYLLDKTGKRMNLLTHCYYGLFSQCKSLVSAPELPATTLAERCYGSMFAECSSLVSIPELPAEKTVNYCYNRMFYRCTSLEVAQEELKVEKLNGLYCYCEMYRECTKLRKAPIIRAKSLYAYCFRYMFWGCTNLKIRKGGSTSTGYVFMSIPSDAASALNWSQGTFGSTGGTYKNDPQIGVEYQCYDFEES